MTTTTEALAELREKIGAAVKNTELQVIARRSRLIAKAGEDTLDSLADELGRLAYAEGQAAAAYTAQSIFLYRDDEDTDVVDASVDTEVRTEIRRWLTDDLLRGAEDTSSGRGNDVRRARFDGFRDQARSILRWL